MYIDALENMPPAGSAASQMKVTIAPVDYSNSATG